MPIGQPIAAREYQRQKMTAGINRKWNGIIGISYYGLRMMTRHGTDRTVRGFID